MNLIIKKEWDYYNETVALSYDNIAKKMVALGIEIVICKKVNTKFL